MIKILQYIITNKGLALYNYIISFQITWWNLVCLRLIIWCQYGYIILELRLRWVVGRSGFQNLMAWFKVRIWDLAHWLISQRSLIILRKLLLICSIDNDSRQLPVILHVNDRQLNNSTMVGILVLLSDCLSSWLLDFYIGLVYTLRVIIDNTWMVKLLLGVEVMSSCRSPRVRLLNCFL